ncbi:MAG: hypothetical protein LBI56_01025 [Puniceicoccales bacterium]|jgi:hypothetical protein|nr:hypothetical protein [Puniceicoccales bacterium]
MSVVFEPESATVPTNAIQQTLENVKASNTSLKYDNEGKLPTGSIEKRKAKNDAENDTNSKAKDVREFDFNVKEFQSHRNDSTAQKGALDKILALVKKYPQSTRKENLIAFYITLFSFTKKTSPDVQTLILQKITDLEKENSKSVDSTYFLGAHLKLLNYITEANTEVQMLMLENFAASTGKEFDSLDHKVLLNTYVKLFEKTENSGVQTLILEKITDTIEKKFNDPKVLLENYVNLLSKAKDPGVQTLIAQKITALIKENPANLNPKDLPLIYAWLLSPEGSDDREGMWLNIIGYLADQESESLDSDSEALDSDPKALDSDSEA